MELKKNGVWDWIKVIMIAIILTIMIRSFLFSPYVVKGESMMPTLQDKERIVVTKFQYYMHEPDRGDIVIFHASEVEDYVKRVIARPGETVEMKEDQLYINGEKTDEPYLAEYKQKRSSGDFFNRDFGPITVPDEHVFVLGDNRVNSIDSRDIGPVHQEMIVGRASMVFYPFTQLRMP